MLVLVLLVAAWGLVLGPALLRNSQDPSPVRTERVFKRALRAIGRQRKTTTVLGGRWVLVPPRPEYPVMPAEVAPVRPQSAAMRRRRITSILAAVVIGTFVLGLLPPLRFLLVVNLVADVLFIAYLVAAIVLAARPVPKPVQQAHPQTVASPPGATPEAAGGGW